MNNLLGINGFFIDGYVGLIDGNWNLLNQLWTFNRNIESSKFYDNLISVL